MRKYLLALLVVPVILLSGCSSEEKESNVKFM